MYGTELTLLCYNESGPSPTSDEPLVVRDRELVVRTRARRPIDLARPVRSKRLRAVGDGPVLVAHVDELVVLDVRLKEALALEARALGEFLLVRDRLALQAAAVALAGVAVCAHRLNSRVAAESVPQRLGAVVRRRRARQARQHERRAPVRRRRREDVWNGRVGRGRWDGERECGRQARERGRREARLRWD